MVTTFKDFTRLPEGWRQALSGEVLCLGIKLEILKGRGAWIDALARLAPTASGLPPESPLTGSRPEPESP